jgi:hypothetical protein
MKYILFSFFVLFISCSTEKNWDTIIFENLQKLSADQILADVEIDGEVYFGKKDTFKANVLLNEMACQLEFSDQNLGKINVRIEAVDWSKSSNKKIMFKNGKTKTDGLSGSLLIGKNKNGTPEGFVLFNGSVEIKQLNENACVIVIHGDLINPANEKITKPIEGVIVWKLPKVLSIHPNWKEFYF